MKELARYTGKVNNLRLPPQASSVILTEVATGKVIETGAVSERLIAAGLTTGDEFEVVIQQSIDGKIAGVIRKKNSDLETDFNI